MRSLSWDPINFRAFRQPGITELPLYTLSAPAAAVTVRASAAAPNNADFIMTGTSPVSGIARRPPTRKDGGRACGLSFPVSFRLPPSPHSSVQLTVVSVEGIPECRDLSLPPRRRGAPSRPSSWRGGVRDPGQDRPAARHASDEAAG